MLRFSKYIPQCRGPGEDLGWGGGGGVCQLAWEHLGILHLDKVAEERQDWASLLRHLPWLNG